MPSMARMKVIKRQEREKQREHEKAQQETAKRQAAVSARRQARRERRQREREELIKYMSSRQHAYDPERALRNESEQQAHENRGLTIQDVMKVTVPYRNQPHYRTQSLALVTGATKSSRTGSAETISASRRKQKEYFSQSYIPPGMAPPKSKARAKKPTPQELAELARQQAKPRRQKASSSSSSSRRPPSTGSRRSFNEGSNQRFRPKVIRDSAASARKQAAQHSPTKPRYHYPGERRLSHLANSDRPPVPPSRRKMREHEMARSARGAHSASSAEAVLRVERVLAAAARGKLNTGQWSDKTTRLVSSGGKR